MPRGSGEDKQQDSGADSSKREGGEHRHHSDSDIVGALEAIRKDYKTNKDESRRRDNRQYGLAIATLGVAIVYAAVTIGIFCITREGVESVQRAFVFPTGISLYAPAPGASNPGMAITYIENAGVTAATDLVIVNNRQMLPFSQNLGAHFDFPDPGPTPPAPRVLGPKETTTAAFVPVNPVCLDLLSRHLLRMFEWGRMTYRDAFGAPHETDFCFFSVGDVVEYPSGGNRRIVFYPCAEHTCVYEACPTRRTEYTDVDDLTCEAIAAQVQNQQTPVPTKPALRKRQSRNR